MNIWLIGAGIMSMDYLNVLNALNVNTIVIGRGEASAKIFTDNTNCPVVLGGLDMFISTQPALPDAAIVSVGVNDLYVTSKKLIDAGVRKILVEKPAGLNSKEISDLNNYANFKNANIVLGYNRRFYTSVISAQKMIDEDGGPTSLTFEFTEWPHTIGLSTKPKEILKNWFLANSSHVVDLAFFLGGEPEEINCFHAGSLDWHPSASSFAGAGITLGGVPFSYHANWGSPGRWSVEVLSSKRRYIFRPLEQLHIQEIGSIAITKVDINDSFDTKWKPGLYLQVKNFLENDLTRFCTLEQHTKRTQIYDQIAGIKQ